MKTEPSTVTYSYNTIRTYAIVYILYVYRKCIVCFSMNNGLMNGWVDGWMDGWMDGWVDGWMDG